MNCKSLFRKTLLFVLLGPPFVRGQVISGNKIIFVVGVQRQEGILKAQIQPWVGAGRGWDSRLKSVSIFLGFPASGVLEASGHDLEM